MGRLQLYGQFVLYSTVENDMSSRKTVTRILEWTGERYLPWTEDPVTSYEHWHRYAFASQFTPGKRVLDMASGEGYGAALLSRSARATVGVELERDAVQHACQRYGGGNLNFIVASASSIPLQDGSFDVITCFELVEHIQEQNALLREAKRLLAPDGLLLISTPNKPEYKQTESNPFHTRELELSEFHSLLSGHFKQIRLLGQRVYSCSSLWPVQPGGSNRISEFLLSREGDEFVLSNSSFRTPLYFLALATNADALPPFEESVLVDTSNSFSKLADRIQRELETTVRSQKEALAWRDDQVKQLEEALSWTKGQVVQLKGTISSHERALAWREAQVNERNQAFEALQSESARAINELQEALRILQSSRSWRLIQKFRRITDRALPAGTGRRRLFDRLLARIT